jgi:hypothetical protein
MTGIQNLSRISMENITQIANITNPTDFFVNVNNTIYGGVLYFIILFVLWIILILIAQEVEDDLLRSIFYGGVIVSVVSLLFRAMYISTDGLAAGMLTDWQMWLFPIITSFLGALLWALKDYHN